MAEPTEKELIERAKEGESEAFVTLVSGYRNRLYRKACSLLGDPEEAEDILQEAMLSAYLALKSFRGESGIYTWLYRILVNKCRDHLRSNGSRRKMEFLDPFTMNIIDPGVGIEKNHEHREAFSYLTDKIGKLGDKYRRILTMRYFDQMSYQEIAEVMGIHVGTVKSRLFKARELLRREIMSDGKGEIYLEE